MTVRALTASTIQRERVEWLWPGRIPLGGVTLLVGDPGLGKSLLTVSLAAQLSRGELPGGPGIALLATAEDSLAATMRPRLEAAQADLGRVAFIVVERDGLEETLQLPGDLAEVENVVAETAARLVVIDPLMAHLPETVNSWSDQSTGACTTGTSRRASAPCL